MRRQTTRSLTPPRHVRVALFTAFVLATGTACSWGDDGASDGDTTQSAGPEGEANGRGAAGDGDSGGNNRDSGDSGDGDTGGAVGSYVRMSRATQKDGGGYPVGAIADEAAADMAADCPGDELCIQIDIQSDDLTCEYAGSDPAFEEGKRIPVDSTITLFVDCESHWVPNPNEPGQYIEVSPEATDEPSTPSNEPSPQPSPSIVPSLEPTVGPTPGSSDGVEG